MSVRRRSEAERLRELLRLEQQMHRRGIGLIAGVDEAGRGPLAGPVVAAAVLFPPGTGLEGVDDSKVLSPRQREELFPLIMDAALAVGVGMADHRAIDRRNILQATFDAMHQALGNLKVRPDHVLVDGNQFRCDTYPFTTVVDGDALCFSVAAASVIAKVTRDRLMVACDVRYPGYGFARHKGYATAEHCEALRRLGPCEIHRRSFLTRLLAAPGECVPPPSGL